jgi:hypothetical protein
MTVARKAALVPALLLLVLTPCLAQQWHWNAKFTPKSDPALIALYDRVTESSLAAGQGVPVRDVTFEAPDFKVLLENGTIWQEAPIEGYPAGAWFEGTARIRFEPRQRKARADLQKYFGAEKLQDIPVTWVYLFTLRETPLGRQLGMQAPPSVPSPASAAYTLAKAAMRQLGTELVLGYLNRDGRSKGAAWVLFAPEAVRSPGNTSAALLYRHDPAAERVAELTVFAHSAAAIDPWFRARLEQYPEYKYTFIPVAWTRREPNSSWVPPTNVDKYTIALDFPTQIGDASEEAVVAFTPEDGVAALGLGLTSRLQVEAVTGADGQAVPFLQWEDLPGKPNFDEVVLVRPPKPFEAGKPTSIKVVSKGSLFDPSWFWRAAALAEEDNWYPSMPDRDGAGYETSGTTPKGIRFVSAGKQLADEVAGGRRTVRFATTKPAFDSSFYIGGYDIQEQKTDGKTRVEFYVDRNTGESKGTSATDYAAQEIANAVQTFNKILDAPLEFDDLRVVTVPTCHGRGFEGLLLLSGGGALTSSLSGADIFRAHEVAHQWWGDMVGTDAWPEDRWLSESIAEYVAMEFYQTRFKDKNDTRARMRDLWVTPLRKASSQTVLALDGRPRAVSGNEIHPLIDGDQNVYTKGPLVLHHLRYIFKVMKKNDDGFWVLLQDFLAKNKHRKAGTAEFIALAEERLGGKIGWFWDQWIYGTKIPTVSWSYDVKEEPAGGWSISVKGMQEDSEFQLAIPVFVKLKGGRTLDFPLLFQGREGKAQARMKEKPSSVSVNDDYEAPVFIK